MARTREVYVEVDLSDFEDEDIREEFKSRRLADQGVNWPERDTRLLAEMIAAGETDNALDLLHRLANGGFSVALIKRLAPSCSQRAAN
jgi:hypothetical protein